MEEEIPECTIMSDEDRSMENAALLLDEKIEKRITSGVSQALRDTLVFGALLENSAFQQAIRNMIETEVKRSLRHMEANRKSIAQTSDMYKYETYLTKGNKL